MCLWSRAPRCAAPSASLGRVASPSPLPLFPKALAAMGLAARVNQPRPALDTVLRSGETPPPWRRRIQPREYSRMGGRGGHGRQRRRGIVAGDVAVEEEARRRCRRRSPVATSRRRRLCWGTEVLHDMQAWRRRLHSLAGTTSTASLVAAAPFQRP
ncbi:hypothetical protein PVAP13_5NG398200 [Panicum virgatum]|uniref:Uncharacterized protein n=1 Tax=Panicum virgatum TaxID=38727 RepID=A0A8T0RW59_PANVG|nr:hypothetical protein PVAP13_5NG398200 [Panicum virgatum]